MQIARAQLEAASPSKKLLLIAGGKWCGWCQVLDRTFQTNPSLTELRDKSFIVVHVNVSEENSNECALRAYPKATSFPFVYVLDATGRLMGTEDTRDWESSDGYDPHQVEAFLKKW
jgi:thioredoxin-related protein